MSPDATLCRSCTNKSSKGENHGSWKGGRVKDSSGYIKIYDPSHPTATNGRYVLEHRVVMESHLGRHLYDHENVHHLNGDRTDNRIENLELWSSNQPAGQRVEDKIEYAKEILQLYADFEPIKRGKKA